MAETPSQDFPAVLVVDDEKIMQDVMRDILEEYGFRTEVSDNGEDALELLRNNDYALIFADIRMPKMDGMEFLRQAKRMKQDVDIIMMTGFASVDVAVEAMKLGALDFILKTLTAQMIEIMLFQISNGFTISSRERTDKRFKIVTTNKEMRRLLEQARGIADSQASVFAEVEAEAI